MVNDARDSAETAASDDPSALGTKGDLERLRTENSGEFREELERANEERLYEKADASYYFRVQTMLMYDPLTARTLANFVAVLVLILLQVFSLTCIQQMSWLASEWARLVEEYDIDDERLQSAYRAGLPYPSSFHDLLEGHDSVYLGLPLLIIGPIILCGLAVSLLTLSGEVEQLKAGYLMMRREWILADPAATRPRAAERAFRIGACSLISILRASLVWFYFDIVGLMMGSADGPFNLLLNALAMGFILELDDVLQPDLPSQNFFGVNHPRLFQLYEERTARARAMLAAAARVARAAPAGLRRAYHACNWITPTVVVVAVISNAWLLQKATSKGTIMTFDDESKDFGGRRETMTLTYNWMLYVLLLALLVDVQVCILCGCRDVFDDAGVGRRSRSRSPRSTSAWTRADCSSSGTSRFAGPSAASGPTA
ncbi:methyltransferase [Aureococcus anophagefferens]|nr:methyltransferase [Aureococcus anophagefferens]